MAPREDSGLTDHAALAARLRDAYRTGQVAPLRDGLDPGDGEGAYRVQALNTEYWRGAGRRIVGRKIGLTNPAVQAQLGVGQPDYGVLFNDMRVADGGTLAVTLLQPKCEAEVALIMGRDLDDPDATPEDVVAAARGALAAIEIVDSRIEDWKISFADTVADNGSSACFVLGQDERPLDGLDLYACGMVLEVDGKPGSLGAGAACLGHPLNAAAWLARTLARNGVGLKAGDIVLTGALGPMVTMTPGSTYKAIVGGLGSCAFTYAGGDR